MMPDAVSFTGLDDVEPGTGVRPRRRLHRGSYPVEWSRLVCDDISVGPRLERWIEENMRGAYAYYSDFGETFLSERAIIYFEQSNDAVMFRLMGGPDKG